MFQGIENLIGGHRSGGGFLGGGAPGIVENTTIFNEYANKGLPLEDDSLADADLDDDGSLLDEDGGSGGWV